MDGPWRGKERKEKIGARVCVARVLVLTDMVKQQLLSLYQEFNWTEGHELHVAIQARGSKDVVLGYVISLGGAMTEMHVADHPEIHSIKEKLAAAIKEQAGHPQQKPHTGGWKPKKSSLGFDRKGHGNDQSV